MNVIEGKLVESSVSEEYLNWHNQYAPNYDVSCEDCFEAGSKAAGKEPDWDLFKSYSKKFNYDLSHEDCFELGYTGRVESIENWAASRGIKSSRTDDNPANPNYDNEFNEFVKENGLQQDEIDSFQDWLVTQDWEPMNSDEFQTAYDEFCFLN